MFIVLMTFQIPDLICTLAQQLVYPNYKLSLRSASLATFEGLKSMRQYICGKGCVTQPLIKSPHQSRAAVCRTIKMLLPLSKCLHPALSSCPPPFCFPHKREFTEMSGYPSNY